MIKYIYLPLVILTACATPTEKIVTKHIVLSPPSSLLQECKIPKPIATDKYIKSTYIQKEDLLFNLSFDLYKSLNQCNTRIRATKEWISKQESIYKESENEK